MLGSSLRSQVIRVIKAILLFDKDMQDNLFPAIPPERLHMVESLAEPVGKLWRDLQDKYTREGEFFVAAPLSSTPLPIYQWIVLHADTFPNWEKTNFVLMDEMVEGEHPPFTYVPTTDAASYEGFARKHFLDPLQQKTSVKNQIVKPAIQHMQDFHTPIDLLLLALGVKGNYANVMPGTPLETGWHTAHLIPEFRQAHTASGSQSYAGAVFREYGMSLGPQQVLAAKNILVIISGKGKRQLTQELFSYNHFDPSFPISIVHHPDIKERVQFYVTRDVVA